MVHGRVMHSGVGGRAACNKTVVFLMNSRLMSKRDCAMTSDTKTAAILVRSSKIYWAGQEHCIVEDEIIFHQASDLAGQDFCSHFVYFLSRVSIYLIGAWQWLSCLLSEICCPYWKAGCMLLNVHTFGVLPNLTFGQVLPPAVVWAEKHAQNSPKTQQPHTKMNESNLSKRTDGINKADKDSTIVIMNRFEYVNKGNIYPKRALIKITATPMAIMNVYVVSGEL